MKKILGAGVLLTLAACQTFETPESQRVAVSFSGSGYNSVANQYYPHATFAEVLQYDSGEEFLFVEVDDKVWSDAFKSYQPRRITFAKAHTAEYIAAIDKFDEWSKIATQDGDMITKEIARVPTYNGKVRFQMHSGNASAHYLVTDFCLNMCLSDTPISFAHDDAMKLRDTLAAFGRGELAIDPNQSDKYQ